MNTMWNSASWKSDPGDVCRPVLSEAVFSPPVLALHGSTNTGGLWQGTADYLRGRHRLIAPDLSCHCSRWTALGIPAVAGALLGAMSEPMHLVGHGHGAAVALEIALMRPELVKSLTLIEPALFHLLRAGAPSDLALFAELAGMAEKLATTARASGPSAGMRAYIDFWHGAGAWRRTSEGLRQELVRHAEQAGRDLATALAATWPANRCRALGCPTLAVMALDSPVLSLRVTEMVAEAIPGARLAIVPDAGHMALLTAPHIVNPMIAAHLRAADGVRTARKSRLSTTAPSRSI
ncbi:alpha/beta fold hydrolase [Aminobacter ciceronei]|jgi:pimeloyl-ACP methyl ester carboxylesterase|uniref:Pimeloyl-ACP methyl ester carboxylesterase n=1 Tax=Aminobacter ciceronei TaxID=150723 RepID=A0ABR6C794_9HYPH|nr:alpha/beta hydrolase [Aminobacter ciceronei]MBA8906854.1 pimeloyl-ACP methyl ester carboxylesterase [Aminobacter ciceronei]MBA9020888.1 pimeloyl-ACP methyl ester carboxylesterase [Aminobacter ciceronei]